jgi:hypothetical protein
MSKRPLQRGFDYGAQSCRNVLHKHMSETYNRAWQRYMITSTISATKPRTSQNLWRLRSLNDFHTTTEHRLNTSSDKAEQSTVQDLVPLTSQAQSTEAQDLPWYLKSHYTAAPIVREIELPPLPDDPPPLLLPILQYLATTRSSIFDLSVMDLRAIEPSPALGSNLLMIMGTARSSQHVHAFSDRLCRWLRSEHKLRPKPDGLLGRQQIKVWRRRAAKKVRAMALAGAASGFEEKIGRDIGLPDWICINVGSIPAAPGAVKQSRNIPEGFIGFDQDIDKVTLAIHVLTEDRRAELDLEGFWVDRLQNILGGSENDVESSE